jgi:hypothetical protein
MEGACSRSWFRDVDTVNSFADRGTRTSAEPVGCLWVAGGEVGDRRTLRSGRRGDTNQADFLVAAGEGTAGRWHLGEASGAAVDFAGTEKTEPRDRLHDRPPILIRPVGQA